MKLWRSCGSAHSAKLAIVGVFEAVEDAELAEQVVEDFVNANWEERYPDVKAFADAWEGRLPAVRPLGPNQSDFEMGLNDTCQVRREGTTVEVARISSTEIGGIIKLMLLKYPTEVRVLGTTGP